FAGVLVDLAIADAVARFPIDLVEADLLALAGSREKLNRAGHERKAQKTFPVRMRGHGALLHNRTDHQSTEYARRIHRFRRDAFPIRSIGPLADTPLAWALLVKH